MLLVNIATDQESEIKIPDAWIAKSRSTKDSNKHTKPMKSPKLFYKIDYVNMFLSRGKVNFTQAVSLHH